MRPCPAVSGPRWPGVRRAAVATATAFSVVLLAGTPCRALHGQVRAVASDIDGTLLDSSSRLSRFSEAALVRLLDRRAELQWHFIPATGKCRAGALSSLGGDVADLIRRGPGVFNQGLQVFGLEGELLWEQTLASDIVAAVEALATDATLVGYCGDALVTTQPDARTNELHARFCEPLPAQVPSLAETASKESMHKLLLLAEPDAITALRPVVVDALGDMATLTQALPTMIEVLPRGCSKGKGLSKLLAAVGVDPADCVAFGDAENDLEMLGMVGLGCSVANGLPVVRAAADLVVPANDNDGVPRALGTLLDLSPPGADAPTTIFELRAALDEAGLLLP